MLHLQLLSSFPHLLSLPPNNCLKKKKKRQEMARVAKQNCHCILQPQAKLAVQTSLFLQMLLIYPDISDIPRYLDKTM